MDGHDPAADPSRYPGDAAATADEDGSSVDMFDGYYSTDDLFELLWHVGGEGGSTGGQPEVSCLRSAPPPATQPPPSLPSEDVMTAWLYPIVSGHDLDGNNLKQPVAKEDSETAESKGKLPAPDGMISGAKDINTTCDSGEKEKASGGSSGRKGSSLHSATHNIAEKRRRCRIADRLRTLQQLVPGCEKSNQASTLEQTIQYMKSLQQQLQAMNTCPAPPLAVYPFAMPIPSTVAAVAPAPGTGIPPAGIVPMVQFGAMLPYPHSHAMVLPAAAAGAPRYPLAPRVVGRHPGCNR